MRWSLLVVLVAVVASGVVFWFAPLLGAIMMIGSVGALGIVVFPAVVDRIAGWLSGASYRRPPK
jgi:hypothetical protein